MIAQINGRLIEKNPTHVVIDCGGVGYEINISLTTYSLIKEENCKLYTHLVVREDAQSLYGFYEQKEKSMFLLLISVSGVGASTALMLLSSLTVDEIQQSIIQGDAASLEKVKGIGKKSAQRIIIDLRDKLAKGSPVLSNIAPINNTVKDEALSALVMLGFSKNIAEKTVDKILQSEESEITVEELIKKVLKGL